MRDIRDIIKEKGKTQLDVLNAYNDIKNANRKDEERKNTSIQSFRNMLQYGNPTVGTIEVLAAAIGCDVVEFFQEPKTEHPATCSCPHCGKPIKIELS